MLSGLVVDGAAADTTSAVDSTMTGVESLLDGMPTTTTIIPSTVHPKNSSDADMDVPNPSSPSSSDADIHSTIASLETRLNASLYTPLHTTLLNSVLPRKWALDRKERRVRKWAEDAETLFRLKARVAPVRRLGDGVLGEVFGWCVFLSHSRSRSGEGEDGEGEEGWTHTEWTALRLSTFNTRAAPWVLTHVCRSWRSLAHRLPSLWTALSFSKMWMGERYRRSPPASSLVLVPLIEEWITRSHDLPMNVHLEGGEGKGTLFTVFATESTARWVRLSLGAVFGSVRHLICDTRFPELRALSVDYSAQMGHSSEPLTVDAPKLSTLRLTHVNNGRLELPWAQIRTVELCDTPWDVLANLTSVETIHISDCSTARIIPFDRVVLPSAKSLYLEDWSDPDLEPESQGSLLANDVLAQFDFPHLEFLSIGALPLSPNDGESATNEGDSALRPLPTHIPPSVTTLITHTLVRSGLLPPSTSPAPKQTVYLRTPQSDSDSVFKFVAIELRPLGNAKTTPESESLLRALRDRRAGLLGRVREIVSHPEFKDSEGANPNFKEGANPDSKEEANPDFKEAIQDVVGSLAQVERVRVLCAEGWDEMFESVRGGLR